MSSKILFKPEPGRPNSWLESKKNDQVAAPEFRGLPNRALITLVLSLTGFGIMAVYSASAPEALHAYHDSMVFLRRQALAALIGLVMMYGISRFDYRKLREFDWLMALVSLGLLSLTLIPGIALCAKGSSRWLVLGPMQFQPSELCKVSCIILLSSGLSQYFWLHRQTLARVVVTVVSALIIVKQPDLGTAMMLIGALLVLLCVSATSLLLMVGFLVAGAGLVWRHVAKTPYQLARIQSWLNPYQSPQKEGWNIIQSLLAVGSGGLWGRGYGGSLQKLYYLPVQHADFIFAVIAEEFGFLGCLVLVALFVLFGYLGFTIALESRTLFGRLLAIGITSSICLQAMVNIMVTTGLLPVTGITLPLISYGGSSLVITLSMIGVLLSISRDRRSVDEDINDVVQVLSPVC